MHVANVIGKVDIWTQNWGEPDSKIDSFRINILSM